MFIISLKYKVELSSIDTLIEPHIAFLEKYYDSGCFLASGRKVPRTGGVILAQADSLATIQAIIAEDPFYQNDYAHYEITEFVPSKAVNELCFLVK